MSTAAPRCLARPRNQLSLDHEVACVWRPLRVSGRTQHSCQVALQRDIQALAIGLDRDGLDERSNGVRRVRAALFALQRQTEPPNLLAIDVGHARVHGFPPITVGSRVMRVNSGIRLGSP